MFRIIAYNNRGVEILKFNFSVCPEVLSDLLKFNLIQLKTSKSFLTFSQTSSFGIFNDGIPTIYWDSDFPQIETIGQVNELFLNKNKIVFVSSKDGSPVNIYYGKRINYKETNIPNLTHLVIDGMDMYLYNLSFIVLNKNTSLSLA